MREEVSDVRERWCDFVQPDCSCSSVPDGLNGPLEMHLREVGRQTGSCRSIPDGLG